MKRTLQLLALTVFLSVSAQAQSRKGIEYSGTKARYSMIGKSKIFSEGVKTIEYEIFFNKKKNTLTVNAGPKDKWYVIELVSLDTIAGNLTHVGRLEGTEKETDVQKIAKSRCEVRFLLDKVSIKIGESKLEEYLLDGAKVWEDKPMGK
ncbi:MAG: hypothetical protein ACK5B6_02005 [Bacteroidia bacterium]|jgi:hypothetical protein